MAKVYLRGEILSGKMEILALTHIAKRGIYYEAKLMPHGETVLLVQLYTDPAPHGLMAVECFMRDQSDPIIDCFEHEGSLFVVTEPIGVRP